MNAFFGPYCKSQLKLNSKKVELKLFKISFVCVCIFFILKARLQALKSEFYQINWGRTTDKLAINWQNFAEVRLQTKLAFRIRSLKQTSWSQLERKFAVSGEFIRDSTQTYSRILKTNLSGSRTWAKFIQLIAS